MIKSLSGVISLEVGSVVLAAGESRRFGSQKLKERIDGATMLEKVLRVAMKFGEVIVVVNPRFEEELEVDLTGFDIVINRDWKEGISSSVRMGLKRAAYRGFDAALVFLADMPFISEETVGYLLKSAENSERYVLYPVYRGSKGFPTFIRREAFDLVNILKGDEGFRRIIGSFPEICEAVEVDDPGCVADIDTPSDLRIWREGETGWNT